MRTNFPYSLKQSATKVFFLRAEKFLEFGFLSCFFLAIPGFAQATTYYVDATAGSDSNAGTTTSSAWKTVAQVTTKGHSTTNPFKPGDSILFKKGEVWRERLAISSSGTSASPIVIGSYGDGLNKPIISGADKVNPALWANYSGSIYVADVGNIPTPNQLYMDGVYYELARYPANGYLIATATSSNSTTVIDTALTLPTNDLAGSTLVARPNSWTSQAVKVSAYDVGTGTITTSQVINYKMVAKAGFYLRNKLWMLKSAGQWFYDSSTGKLYIQTAAGNSPA